MSEPLASNALDAASWLAEPRARLAASVAADHAPQALLIHDSPGAGGDTLAPWVARLLLCTADSGKPCGVCAGCQNALHNRHPDLVRVGLEEDSQQIKIDQVRELKDSLALASHQGGWRIAILDPADAMNRNAANSLLKTLEEPSPRTLLVLVAQQPSRLPATIHSRCLRVRIPPPTRAEALQWLQTVKGAGDWNAVLDLIGNAPLLAATLDPAAVTQLRQETLGALQELAGGAGDAAGTADRWTRADLGLRLACFENWIADRIRSRLGAVADTGKMWTQSHAPASSTGLNALKLFEALDRLREFRAALTGSMNRALALESLLRFLSA